MVLVALLVAALALTTSATQVVLRTYLMNRTAGELRSVSGQAADNSFTLVASRAHVQTLTLPGRYFLAFQSPSGDNTNAFVTPGATSNPVIPPLPINDPLVTGEEPFTVGSSGKSDDQWLVLAGVLNDRSGVYAIAIPLRGVDETMTQLWAFSLAIGLLVTGACAAVGYAGISRAFRPLRQMEDTAAAIADGDLGRRIPVHAAQDEVASLSRSLNAMLSHIESSFAVREASEDRMRRFVTDASHELRTPLATIRGYAELYRQGAAASPEATASAMRRIEDEATRMSGLVEDLLTLARLDNQRPMNVSEVDLTVLAGDAVSDAKAREPERPVRLVGLGERSLGPAVLRGDEARLRQVVTNLLANALQHTPRGTPVEVAVGPATLQTQAGPVEGFRVEVRDHGAGIAPEDIDRVFQRFYRGDPSRGRASGGSGLGLAIVMAIVNSHGGRVGIRATDGGGATFVVEFPTESAASSSHSIPHSENLEGVR